LLAKAPCQSPSTLPDTPLSRASPLPHWICIVHNIHAQPKHCGSGLAREEAGKSSITADRHTAIAGRPAPTGGYVAHNIHAQPKHCGSGLAREGAVSVAIDVA